MNYQQRMSNRRTAARLCDLVTPVICPECGQPGHHFAPPSFGMEGFLTCDKFYGPDGRRVEPVPLNARWRSFLGAL